MDIKIPPGEEQNVQAFIDKASSAGYTEDEIMESINRKYASFGENLAAAQQQQSRQAMTHQAPPSAPKDMYARQAAEQSFGQNLLAGIGGGLTGLTGLAMSPEEARDYKASMSGLGTTGGGAIGSMIGYGAPAAIAAPFTGASVPVVAGVSALEGFLQPAESGRERLQNTALYGGSGALGQKLGNMLAARSTANTGAKVAESQALQNFNAVHQKTIEEASKAGYVFPPSAFGKTSLLEGIGGQIKTQQEAAFRNQRITDQLMRDEFKLSPNVPLVADTFKALRKEAGKPYEELKKFGKFEVDSKFQLSDVMPAPSKPSANSALRGNAPDFYHADRAVKELSRLREQGYAALNAARDSAEPAKLRDEARQFLDAANQLESLIERNLQNAGRQDVIDNLRQARQTIAKTYDAEDAVSNASGHVDALKLGRNYEDGMKGNDSRLTGNLELIGRTASAMSESMRQRKFRPLRNTAVDTGVTAITGAAGIAAGHPLALAPMAIPYMRNPVREGLMSQKTQAKLVKPNTYKPGIAAKATPAIGRNALSGLLLGSSPLLAQVLE